MASAATYTEELFCSVCLSIFTEPVSLSCGHSFCRECLTNCLRTENRCPHCRAPTAESNFSTNYILKSLADIAKKEPTGPNRMQSAIRREGTDWLCPDHEEKLKLFCETDQQLVCVICRDGEKHDSHKFKPIKEAASARRQELDEAVQFLTHDNDHINIQTKQQEEEIIKTETKCRQLTNQISTQFEELHQFLRKREDEIKKDLIEKEMLALENMRENLKSMEVMESERKEMEVRLRSALEIPDSERFLDWWNDRGLSELEGLKESDVTPPPKACGVNMTKTDSNTDSETPTKPPYRSRVGDMKVIPDNFSLGPYESHLQFFVWKQMLEVIKPLPERLTLKTRSENLNISNDGRSVLWSNKNATSGENKTAEAFSHLKSSYITGQHCWEIEVGIRESWEVGVNVLFRLDRHFKTCLDYCNNKYTIVSRFVKTEVTMKYKPRNILMYLNFPTMQLSFYNADSMELIYTVTLKYKEVFPYVRIGFCNGMNPLTVRWY